MKTRFCAALLLAVLAISIFTGCAANAAQLDTPKAAMENPVAPAEITPAPQVEVAVTDPPAAPAAEIPAPEAVAPAPEVVAPALEATAPAAAEAALLTKEEAEKIALEHAGLSANQVQKLRTELDYERGKPEYEVDFHVDRIEYDYEIDAKTGKIISWDKDWDD